MKDRFSDASKELSEKNAFICESCNVESEKAPVGEQFVEIETRRESAHEEGLHVTGLDVGSTRLERIINSDPTPFGA